MELDNNPSLRPHEQEPEQKFPTGTIDQLNVRELSATTVNAQTVQAEEVNASSGDIDSLKLNPLFSDMNRDLNLLVLDDEKQVHRTTVEELSYVLNDDYDFISQDKLTAELNNYTKNNKTNSTITNFNDCPVGFVSMPENSTNAPATSRCYVLTQFYNNNVNFKSQIATVINSNEVYCRNYNNGTWSAWERLMRERDILQTCVVQLDNISIPAESYTTPRDIDISSLVSAQGVDVANSNFWGCCIINSAGASGVPIVRGASRFGFSVQLYNPTNKTITATYFQLAIYYKAK